MSIDNLFLGSVIFASNEDGTYSIPYKPIDVHNALKNVIPQISGFNLNAVNDFGLSLDVSVGISWKSWGETIHISVIQSSTCDSILSIKSKSHMALVDWGKNKENINNILAALQMELANPYYESVQTKVTENDPFDQLLKLKTLLDNNIINKEEYETKKEKLLNRL